MRKIASALFCVFLVVGCATNSKLLVVENFQSLVDYTKALRSETATGFNPLGNGLRALTTGVANVANVLGSVTGSESIDKDSPNSRLDVFLNSEVRKDQYMAYRTYWCTRNPEMSNIEQVRSKYAQICRQRNGNWVSPYCEAQSGEFLFLAAVSDPNHCTTASVEVYLVEPTGNLNAPDYQSALAASGYLTRKQVEARNEQKRQVEALVRQAEVRMESAIAAKSNRVRAEASRGTKVCSLEQGVKTIAFVLQPPAPSGKMEIRIQDLQIGTTGYRPTNGGRHGNIGQEVFVDFHGWEICD